MRRCQDIEEEIWRWGGDVWRMLGVRRWENQRWDLKMRKRWILSWEKELRKGIQVFFQIELFPNSLYICKVRTLRFVVGLLRSRKRLWEEWRSRGTAWVGHTAFAVATFLHRTFPKLSSDHLQTFGNRCRFKLCFHSFQTSLQFHPHTSGDDLKKVSRVALFSLLFSLFSSHSYSLFFPSFFLSFSSILFSLLFSSILFYSILFSKSFPSSLLQRATLPRPWTFTCTGHAASWLRHCTAHRNLLTTCDIVWPWHAHLMHISQTQMT